MRIVAIPVKALGRAKRRLAPALSPLERAALALAMLEDVLDACLGHPGWETWVVSPDEAVLEVAAARRARVVAEGVVDLAGGNPDPALLPPLSMALGRVAPASVTRTNWPGRRRPSGLGSSARVSLVPVLVLMLVVIHSYHAKELYGLRAIQFLLFFSLIPLIHRLV